jgi:hypothetical protein
MAVQDINATTIANLLAQSADQQEVLWKATVAEEAPRFNPFAVLLGGQDSMYPIKNVMDTAKVAGQEIVMTNFAGLGGKGVQGSAVLEGNEEKLKSNNYRLFIGRHRHAAAIEDLVRDMTVIGKKGNIENMVHRALREWLTRTKCDTIEACFIGESDTYNTAYANNKRNLDELGTADYLTEDVIVDVKNVISSNGGEPIAIDKAPGNQMIEKYYFVGAAAQFAGLRQNGSWKDLLATAGDRGKTNWLFGGALPEYDSVLMAEWNIKRTSADAAQGAFAAPEAYLGVAIPAKGTSNAFTESIKGGGFQGDSNLVAIAAGKTLNDYFRYFPNAPYAAFQKTYIAADTSTRRYAMVIHASGADVGKFSFISYTTTDGTQLGAANGADIRRLGSTATGQYETTLTGSTITWNSGAWTSSILSEGEIPINSKIIPVNSKGVPWVRGYMLSNNAMAIGYGSIDGTPSGAFGKKITQMQDYGAKIGRGIDLVFGAKVVQDASDIKPGHVLVYSARPVPGMPDVA